MGIHHYVVGTFNRKIRGVNSKYVRTMVEAVGEEDNVGSVSRHGRQGPKVVNADGDARAVWEGDE